VTISGETKTLSEWAEVYGISFAAISARINKLGWDDEKAITTPLLRKKR
jgi:uncharacterized protein YjcR